MVDIANCYHFTFWTNITSAEGRVIGGIIMIVGHWDHWSLYIHTRIRVDSIENKYIITRRGPEKDITDKIG